MAAHQRVSDIVLQDDDVDGRGVVGHADPVRARPGVSIESFMGNLEGGPDSMQFGLFG